MPLFREMQPAFSAGEVSPSLYGRRDLAKFDVGAKTLLNMFVHAQGGASNRAGTHFVIEHYDHSRRSRLISFEFSVTQAYALEFSHQKMRVIKDGGIVLDATQNITGITQANPAVVSLAGHGYTNGTRVYLDGIVGMTELNGRFFTVSGATTNDFELSGEDSSGHTAYTSGGTSASIYVMDTPYQESELPLLKFVQSADTMYLMHPSHAPRKLTRLDHNNWQLDIITFAPSLSAPTGVTVTPHTSGSETYKYKVTAVKLETLEESLAGEGETSSAATLSSSNYITITWTAPSGDIEKYNIYRLNNGLYGYIGSVDADETLSFKDDYIDPDLSDTPPKARNPFSGADDYPGTVGLHEQRAVFGASFNSPQKNWMSQSANYENLNVSTPTKDDDAVTFTIASHQINTIRHYVSLNDLLILTSGAVWRVNAGQDAAITPSNLSLRPQAYHGSSEVPPIVTGSEVLYVQRHGRRVRDLSYRLESDSYRGNDLMVLSEHILENRNIEEWAYCEEPYSIFWCVLTDGTLAAMTYLREHEVWAWHRHETDGVIESVCSIPEGTEDILYLAVKRKINGSTVRYIERMPSRLFLDIRDAYFVDCGLTYDSPIAISNITQANPAVVTTTSSHGWTTGDTVDLSDLVGMDEANDQQFKIEVLSATTFALQDRLTAEDVDGTGFEEYEEGGYARRAITVVGGLDHLEGKLVSILANGNVEPQQVVAGGSITLTSPSSRIHVGLPYTSDLETLPIQRPGLWAFRYQIAKLFLWVVRSRGIFAGPDTNSLQEYKQRADEDYGLPTELATGLIDLNINPKWRREAGVVIRQTDPLPLTVLATIPGVKSGG